MKKKIVEEWCAALTSGSYKQGKCVIKDSKENLYCSIGVLYDLYEKAHPRSKCTIDLEGELYFDSSSENYEKFLNWCGAERQFFYTNENGLRAYLGDLDDQGKSFEEIANFIKEKHKLF